MEIFVKVKRLLVILGVLILNRPNGRAISVILNVLSIFPVMFVSITSVLFIFFGAEKFAQQAEAMYPFGAMTYSYVACFILIFRRNRILQLLNLFELKIEERKRYSVTINYEEANQKIEKETKRTSNLMFMFVLPSSVVPIMISSYFNYYVKDAQEDSFKLLYYVWTPYNWKTPIAFLLTMIIQTASIFYATILFLCLVNLFHGFSLFSVSFVNDIKRNLVVLDETIKTDPGTVRDGNLSAEARYEVKKYLCNLIQFHSDGKQFVSEVSTFFNSIISTMFMFSAFLICLLLLQIHIGLSIGDYLLCLRSTEVLLAWLYLFYLVCNFGEEMTTHYFDLIDSFYNVSWHLCPLDTQQSIKLMILKSQRPVFLEGFAGFQCTRDKCKAIVNAGYSYFMILRRFN